MPRVAGSAQELPVPVAAGTVGAAKRRGVPACWLVFPEISGLGGIALSLPAPHRLGELAGTRLPPLRKLPLQIEDPEFHTREPLIIVLGKSFESLVHYYHP